MSTRSLTSFGLVLSLSLLALSCFEPPVAEEMRLDFLANGAVAIGVTVEIAGPESQGNAALERRLAALRRELTEGTDPWSARFASLDADAERFSWEKRLGSLSRAERSAVVTDPEKLSDFFHDAVVRVLYTVSAEQRLAELSIVPGPATRANRAERRRVEQALGDWSEAIARYFAAARRLWSYLEDHPERDRAVLGGLFDDLLAEEVKAALEPATAEEEALVEALGDRMGEVWQVLLVSEGDDHSLDELSRRVYDPFPAPLTLRLPGPAELVEGFEVEPEGELRVPGLGFWAALGRLEERWIAPDPLLLYVRHKGAGTELDLDALLGRARRVASETELPAREEVREAIEDGLRPAPLYRAVWAVDPEAEPALPWERPGKVPGR
ncbi:MAG TPA: hypothetical protein VF017_09760 [Thermoanaerobaculia bacterium]|nr:hypothetical protein [Thermoanaerobaculia bacterium]